jgi:thiosulfate reductase/polysulfide reductase chain A
VAKNFVDFDKYKKHILESEYTPEWAEKITGIPADSSLIVGRISKRCTP